MSQAKRNNRRILFANELCVDLRTKRNTRRMLERQRPKVVANPLPLWRRLLYLPSTAQ